MRGGGAFYTPGVESVVSVVQVSATSLSVRSSSRMSDVGSWHTQHTSIVFPVVLRIMYVQKLSRAKEFLFVNRDVMSVIGVGPLLLLTAARSRLSHWVVTHGFFWGGEDEDEAAAPPPPTFRRFNGLCTAGCVGHASVHAIAAPVLGDCASC